MLRKVFVGFMAVVVFSVQAQAADVNAGLRQAFNELNYALQVRGASGNPQAREEASRHFAEQVSRLQAQGLTNAQLLAFAQASITDAVLAREVGTLLSSLQANRLSASEARDMARDMVARSGQRGASWSGRTNQWAVIGAIVLVIVLLEAWASTLPQCGVDVECEDDGYDYYGNCSIFDDYTC